MAKFRGILVRAALLTSLLTPVYFLIAAMGVRFGVLDWRIGYELMTLQLLPLILFGAAILALVSLVLAFFVAPRRGRMIAAVALLIPIAALTWRAYATDAANPIAPLTDVTTDVNEPPGFTDAVRAERDAIPGANSLDYVGATVAGGAFAGRRVAEVQYEVYPQIQPVIASTPAARAYELALATAREQGWTIGAEHPERGRFEARARSFWFGFTDDVSVRVRANPPGSIVDVRSAARVRKDDAGTNARRVERYVAALKLRLASEP